MATFRAAPPYRRIDIPRPEPVGFDYASLWRFGRPDGPAPLLCYVGGLISQAEHAERRATRPEPVLSQLAVATSGEAPARLDFLVCPAPPGRPGGSGVQGKDFLDHLRADLLPELSAPPSTMALVGHSVGAYFAAYVAFREPSACALGLVGASNPGLAAVPFEGNGQVETLDWPKIAGRLQVETYRNPKDTDPNVMGLTQLHPELRVRAMEYEPRRRPDDRAGLTSTAIDQDGHSFAAYARNGAYASAFRSALKRLNRIHLRLG